MNPASTKMSENRGYSRGDGKGVVFLVDAKTEDEAPPVHSRRTLDAAEGIDGPGSAAVTPSR